VETEIWEEDTFYLSQLYFELTLTDPTGENYYLLDLYAEEYFPIFYYDSILEAYDYDSIISYGRSYNRRYAYAQNALFENQNWWGDHIIFDDQTFEGQNFELRLEVGDFYGERDSNTPKTVYYVVLLNLSKEYFQFLKSLYIQQYNSGDPFSEPSPIYSNIENGYGVFAGYSAQRIKLTD
jgi:hypothetical protein